MGEVLINIDAIVEPQLVHKLSRLVSEIEDNILSLYNHSMTVRDIEGLLRERYDVEMSDATISHITDCVIDHIE